MRIFFKARGPETGLRAEKLYYTRAGKNGDIIQSWPRGNSQTGKPWQNYKRAEFAYASFFTTIPEPMSYQTAKFITKGTDLLPRDALVMAMYGTLYRVTDIDGNVWGRVRDVATNPQLVLDLVTDEIGAMLYRAPVGWVWVSPGNNGQVLSIEDQVPVWRDVYPIDIAENEFLTHYADPTLPNARVVEDSASIYASWATPDEVNFKRAALTGDVTAALDSNATTIAPRAVSAAKLFAMTGPGYALGRQTAGAGDVEQLTISQLLDLIGSAHQGDVLIRSSTGWAFLPAGVAGQALLTQGSGADPTWGTPSSAGGASGTPTTPWFAGANTYITPGSAGSTALTTYVAAANQITFVPISVPWSRALTSIGINVPTGGNIAGSQARLAIYNISQTSGGPGSVLLDAGNVSTAAAGFVAATISQSIQPGNYYLAMWTSAAITVRAIAAAFWQSNLGWSLSAATPAPIPGLTRTSAFGSAFASESAQTHTAMTQTATIPLVGIR